MTQTWVGAVLVAGVTIAGCVSVVPVDGASCPCPRVGYCCENSVCVRRATCAPTDAGGGSDASGSVEVTDGMAVPPDAASEATSLDGQGLDAAVSEGGEDGAAGGPTLVAGGHIVTPWPDGSPIYTRAIVRVGQCAGILLEQDWVLTAKRCGTTVGSPVFSVRDGGEATAQIDDIVDDRATGDDAEYLHLSSPIAGVPPVPLYWGSTDDIVGSGNAVTCYEYSGNDLWATLLFTRPHADQTTDPNTFETVRDDADPTIPPGGAGGPCFFHDQLAAVDSGWLPDRTGGLETSFAGFRSWMVTNMRSHRARLFQVVDGAVYFVDGNQQLWREDAVGGNRTMVDQMVRTFHAVSSSAVYVVDVNRDLWLETPDANNRVLVDHTALDVYGMDTNIVYVVGFDQNLWREAGSWVNRALVDGNVLQFAPIGPTRVFVLGYDRNLWNENGDQSDRALVDSAVVSFQPISDQIAYVLWDDFSVLHEVDSYRTNATVVDESAWDLQPIDDTTVYVLGQDGTLWRERGTAADRDRVDGAVARFQALDATTVYVLDQDGNLWREQGDSTARTLVDHR